MYIFNTYKGSRTICKGKKGSMLISGGEGQQEDEMKGRRGIWLDVDPCEGASFVLFFG